MRPPASKGRGFGGARGRGGGKGGRGFGKGRGGRGPEGPPDSVEPVGTLMHDCEGDLVCKLTHAKVPYFNASIYVDKNTRVGKVDEILGPINEVMFTVKPDAGVHASSFKAGDTFSIDPMKLLPMSRFTGGGGGGGGGRGRGKGGKGGRGRGGKGKGRGKGGFGRGKGSPGGGRGRGRGRGW
ncbi:unnamed protein product [Pelagomonas calceolata]|jgi:H/ACA ribonucleoprotein complex subunit 1|uniref:H/ACA ribonucleoprotein complex subunit n=2 Tax=Pelagomonas calceolata TaxID=35677 RepID=A0A8J2S6B6_9STRA|nr:unnamed protein product [Pelagomonas calceolata]